MKSKILMVVVGAVALSGCQLTTRLEDRERALGTGGEDLAIFHRVAEGDQGLGLRFPGFLIGIEKGWAEQIGYRKDLLGIDSSRAANVTDRDRIDGYRNDPKVMFVSHLVEYRYVTDRGLPHIAEDRFYSAYSDDVPADKAYEKGYEAFVKAFRARLDDRLGNGKYTHILVYCMGWNTDQQESLRNYNSLLLQLSDRYATQRDRGAVFRPLVIGVSWPSEWRWPALRGLGILASYPVKANDADELGTTWINLLVNNLLAQLKEKHGNIPLILIGHSFGARAVTRAAASVALIRPEPSSPPVDLVLALQGAFSVNRFVAGEGLEGSPYARFAHLARKYVLTWSRSDTANPIAEYVTGARHAGGAPGAAQSRTDPARAVFEHFRACTSGEQLEFRPEATRLWQDSLRDPSVVTYVDVSAFVRFEAYGKGGKAHSDIYTPAMAELIRSAIEGVVSGLVSGQGTAAPMRDAVVAGC